MLEMRAGRSFETAEPRARKPDEATIRLDRPQHDTLFLRLLFEPLLPGRGHRGLVPDRTCVPEAHVGHPARVRREVVLERSAQRGALAFHDATECHGRRGYGLDGGEAHGELGAAFVYVASGDRAAVCDRDRLSDREAKARSALLRVVTAIEPAEEARLRAPRQARTGIAHAHDRVALLARATHGDGSAARRMLDGVVDEVREELRQPVGVAAYR